LLVESPYEIHACSANPGVPAPTSGSEANSPHLAWSYRNTVGIDRNTWYFICIIETKVRV